MSGTDEKNEQPYAQERTGGVIYLGATHEKLCKLDEHASSTSTRQGPMRLPRGHTGLGKPLPRHSRPASFPPLHSSGRFA